MSELNHKTLRKSLKLLQPHSPDSNIWTKILKLLNDEMKIKSISQLKTKNPPENIWDAIADEMDLQNAINKLPAYEPDIQIWNTIAHQLKNDTPNGFRIKVLRITFIISATAALLLMTYFLVRPLRQQETIHYTVETITPTSLVWNQENDIELRSKLEQLRTLNPAAINHPDYKAKEIELVYLNEKKAEILLRISTFDQHQDLQVLLTRIELEKNEIVKQMVAKFL